MDELAEIRRREDPEPYEPWEDRSGDEHYELYEREPGQAGRLTPAVVRIFAAVLLAILLWATFQLITYQFVDTERLRGPEDPPPGLAT